MPIAELQAASPYDDAARTDRILSHSDLSCTLVARQHLTSYGWVPDAAGRIRRKHQFGVRSVGYLRHDLTGSKASHEFVEPDVFVNIDLGNWLRARQGFITRYGNEPLRGLVFDDWYT